MCRIDLCGQFGVKISTHVVTEIQRFYKNKSLKPQFYTDTSEAVISM